MDEVEEMCPRPVACCIMTSPGSSDLCTGDSLQHKWRNVSGINK